MAEGEIRRGADFSDLERAVDEKLKSAKGKKPSAKVEEVARATRQETKRIEAAVSEASEAFEARRKAIRKLLSIERTEGGGYQVHGPQVQGRGGIPSGRGDRVKTFRSVAPAEAEASRIAADVARRDLPVRHPINVALEQEAQAVEKAEQRKTKAVEEGTKKRIAARKQEGRVVGDQAEYDRIVGERAEELKRLLTPQQTREFERATKPTPEADRERALAQARAQDAFRQRIGAAPTSGPLPFHGPPVQPTPLAPRGAGGGGRAVVRGIAEREAEAEALRATTQAKENARLEDLEQKKQIRAAARKAAADERAAQAAEEQALAEQEARRQRLAEQPRARPTFEQAFGRGGGVRPPVRPPAPPGPPDGGGGDGDDPRARRERELASRRAGEALERESESVRASGTAASGAAQEQQRLGTSLEKTAISADLSSQRFRKHGALTTEFIEAAAKGEVTVRELGYQMTATIGKFAGWTAAATAVYGVVGALQQVTEGALAAESAAGLVGRVVTEQFDTGTLKEDLRGLSAEFNVSMQDAADAVYGAGKTFHDLPGAVKGAQTALFAMKVGELDAAAATDSLASIVRGFGLQADQLPDVMDAINQSTNRFGGNVGQLVQGVARASGQFRLAGGDFRELVAILTAGARLTGASATEVATAISRMVSSVQTPAGAARARRAGLDPTQDPLALIRQAQELARGAPPERVQELARAIIPAGGQFARILVPIIQNADLLNKTLAETQPERAKGSAQRELTKVMSQANEQIAMIGNSLQRLGAALAESGLLAPLLGLVKGVNLAIKGVTNLIDLFNKVVPDPFQKPLATLLEMYGVVRLLRRFDVGGQVAPGGRFEPVRQFISAGPERTSRRQVTQGITAEQRFLRDTRERVSQQAALASFRELQADARLREAITSGDEDLIEQRRAAFLRQRQTALDLVAEEDDLRRLINQNDARRVAYMRNIRRGMGGEQAAVAAGLGYRTADVARPTTQGPVPLGLGRGGAAGDLAAAGVTAGATAVGRTAAEATRLQRAAAALQTRAAGAGHSGRLLGAAAVAAAGSAAGARRGLLAAAAGLRGLGAALVASLGPLDLAIIGLLAGFEAVNYINDRAKARADEVERASKLTGDPDEIQRQIDSLTPARSDEARAVIAQKVAQKRQLEAQQAVGRSLTKDMVKQRLDAARKMAGTPAEEARLIREAIGQLDVGFEATYGEGDVEGMRRYRQELLNSLATLSDVGDEIGKALDAVQDFKQLQQFTDQMASKLELAGGGGREGTRAREAIGRASLTAAKKYAETNDTAAYLDELKREEQAVVDAAEERLKRSLEAARSQRQRHRAHRTYEREVREGLGVDDMQSRLDEIELQNRSRARRIKNLRAKAKQPPKPQIDPLTGEQKLGGLPESGLTPEEQAKLEALRQDQADARKEARALRTGLKRRRQILNDIKREQQKAQFEEDRAVFEARTALGAARTEAGVPRAQYELRRIGILIQRAIRVYGRNSVEVLRLMTEQQQARDQLVQEQASVIESETGLAVARAQTPGGEQSARRAGLNRLLAYQRAHPRQYGAKEINDTLTQLAELNKQEHEQELQDARDLLDARYEWLESLTDDPVKIAELEAEHAQKAMRFAKTPAERYRARAERNRTRRAAQDAAIDAKVEEIELQHDIGNLSDQAYLAALQKQMDAAKKGSQEWKKLRAQVLRFKHDMEQSASEDYELDVGNIRLPSLYEVRRFVQHGAARASEASNQTITDNRVFNVTLATAEAAQEFASQLELTNGTSGRAAARSMRMR